MEYGIIRKTNAVEVRRERTKNMKSTGIVRPIDELGRIVLPKELRRSMDLESKGASVEIFVDEDKIVLKKHAPSCVFCGNASDVVYLKGKLVCRTCVKELSSL